MRIFRQDGRQQKTVPAAYIYNGMHSLKTVSLGNGGAINHRKRSHGVIEDLCFLGVLLQIFEDVGAVNLLERLPAGAHAVFELRPSTTVPLPATHNSEGPRL